VTMMQLERIHVFKIHNVLEGSPDEPLTEPDITPVSEEHSNVIKYMLSKPVKFKCVVPTVITHFPTKLNSIQLVLEF